MTEAELVARKLMGHACGDCLYYWYINNVCEYHPQSIVQESPLCRKFVLVGEGMVETLQKLEGVNA
jgi:hypothetical protein